MKALTYHAPGDFRLTTVPDPRIQHEADAIVRIVRSAICGSDLHLWHGGLPIPDVGFAVGHECVGIVEEVGSAVRSVRRGERVLVSCATGCGGCGACGRGLWSGCSVTTAGGAQNVFGYSSALPGGQAEALRVPFSDTNLFRVPEAVSDEAALLLTDVLPTAAMGAELAEVQAGDVVVVIGCGPVGSLAQRCAFLRGAARVVAVDIDDQRLARAVARGCDGVNPEREDLAERVLALTDGQGADAVIEAVGRPELVQQALTLVRVGGRIAAIGLVPTPVEIPMLALFLRSLSLRSGLVSPQRFVPRLLPLVASGRLDPTEIVTHRLPLADAVRGYRLFEAHAEGALKVVLEV